MHQVSTSAPVTRLDVASANLCDQIRGCWAWKDSCGTLGGSPEEAWGKAEPFDV